ncbi:MAG: hypothetical protein ISR45_04640 [Rhodospirillales bacterium]|nr:hypothetical protein [Rhodospirillales bacterium]
MSIKRPLLCMVLSFMFLVAAFAFPQANSAYADGVSATEHVQIAQSDEVKKPKEGQEDLGEDDC